jgi:hypothetical protein
VVQVTVPPHTLYRTSINALVHHRSVGAIVTADQPVVVERTLDFGVKDTGSTSSTGLAAPITSWTFAAATYDAAHQAFFAILNPDRVAAQVTVEFFDRQGALQEIRRTVVPPDARGNLEVSGMRNTGAVTAVVLSTVPVVVEEPVYLGRPNGSHVSATYNRQEYPVTVR